MASVQLKNNATGTISASISAVATTIVLTTDDGALFPALSGGNYFYATLQDTSDNYEIVKVTALSTDTVTVTRAQESTTAQAFAAGSLFELRVTKQSILDTITANAASIGGTNDFTGLNSFADITTFKTGKATRWFDSTNTNYHEVKNTSNVLHLNYNATDWATVSAAGVVAFISVPLVGAAAVYYVGGTDVALADGGTGSSTASGARTNLGLVISTDVQAYSAKLAALAAQTWAADTISYQTSTSAVSTTTLSSFGRSLIDDAAASNARTTLGLDTMATQAASAVAITGGTVAGLTSFQARVKTSSETSGILTALSANTIVLMTGDITINNNVFTTTDHVLVYSGSSSRTITQGSGVTMRLGGSATTGSRSLAAFTEAVLFFRQSSEVVASGVGVT